MNKKKKKRKKLRSVKHIALSATFAERAKKLHIFPNRRSQNITIRYGFGVQVAETPGYPVTCRFSLFVALYVVTVDQRYRRTDGESDRRHARSVSATCVKEKMCADVEMDMILEAELIV